MLPGVEKIAPAVFAAGATFLADQIRSCFRLCQAGQLGQQHGDRGDIGDQQQTCDDGHIVDQHVGQNLRQSGTANLDADEQGVADGGSDVADAQVVDQDQTEVDGVHAEALADGQEQGGEDQDGGGDIHEGTGDQQDDVHDQQDHVLVVGQTQQSGGNGLGDLHEGHDPAQDVGNTDQEHDHAGGLGGVNDDLPQRLQVDGAVEQCQDQRVDNGDCGALGGGEDTADDAADDDDDQGQGGDGSQGSLEQVGPGELAGGALVALLNSQQNTHDGTGQSPDQAGQVASHEQSGDGGAAGSQGVGNHGIGGGDQQTGGGGSSVGGGGQSGIVTGLLSAVADHGADSGSSSGSGAGDGAEQRVGADVGDQQSAGQLAQNGHNEVDQTLCDTTLVHNVTSQDEEGNCGQRELGHTDEGTLCCGQHGDIQIDRGQDGRQRSDTDAVGDGNTQKQQGQHDCQNDEQTSKCHILCLLLCVGLSLGQSCGSLVQSGLALALHDGDNVHGGVDDHQHTADGHDPVEGTDSQTPQRGGLLTHSQGGHGEATVDQDNGGEQQSHDLTEDQQELLGTGLQHIHQDGDVHVGALAGAQGSAEHGGPAEHIADQLLRPGGGVIQNITGDDLVGGQHGHDDQAQTGQTVQTGVEDLSQCFHCISSLFCSGGELRVVCLDHVVDGLQGGVALQNLVVQGHNSLLEGSGVGVQEVDTLLIQSLLLGGLDGAGPLSTLNGVDDLEALVKDGALLGRQTLQEGPVAQDQVGDHLVHIVGVVLTNVAVTVGGQSQLVVLSAVDDLGLQSGVDIAEAHGGGGTAQQLHHGNVGGGLLHADLQALQVLGGIDGLVHGVEVTGTCIQPGDADEAGILGGQEDGVSDRGIIHGSVVGLSGAEQVGQVEQGVVLGEGLHDGVGRNDDVDCAGLSQLNHLSLRTQQLRGVDFHDILVAQLFVLIDKISEGGQTNMSGVGGGLVVADSDNPLAVASTAAAGKQADSQRQDAQQGYPFCFFHKKHSSLQKIFAHLS